MKTILAALALSAAAITSSQAQIAITEVAPWASGNSPYAADWFELTNTGTGTLTIGGWKMDDSGNSFGAAAALLGITSIGAGESVIFMEGASASAIANFKSTWALPSNVQVGTYTGGGVGLSTDGDGVSIFNGAGELQAKVSFGSSTTGRSFDNSAAANNATIALTSLIGTNGAYAAPLDLSEIGSPGLIAAVPEPATAVFGLALLGVAALSRRRTLALA